MQILSMTYILVYAYARMLICFMASITNSSETSRNARIKQHQPKNGQQVGRAQHIALMCNLKLRYTDAVSG